MQIAFLTLFLGLINGAQTVEIGAGPGVAAIEVVLDGRLPQTVRLAPPAAPGLSLLASSSVSH
jgi:hypothetical protein